MSLAQQGADLIARFGPALIAAHDTSPEYDQPDILLDHYSQAVEYGWWNESRWPNFEPAELSCHHCGEMFFAPLEFDKLQRMRVMLGPLVLTSAHRCPFWNSYNGGAPMSEHKMAVAFDVSLLRYEPAEVFDSAKRAGFTTFGFYGTFLHTDSRPGRRWITEEGKETWSSSGALQALGLQ